MDKAYENFRISVMHLESGEPESADRRHHSYFQKLG
jgi:hypothetical protein